MFNFFPNRFEYEVDYVSSSEFRLPGKQKMRRTIDCEKLSIFLSFGDGENSDWYSVFNNAFLEQEALYVCKNQEDIMEKFAEAKSYEKVATANGSPFTWSEGESLDEMMKPDRVKQIKEDHENRLKRMKSKSQINPLRPNAEPIDIDDLYGQAKVCLACHK